MSTQRDLTDFADAAEEPDTEAERERETTAPEGARYSQPDANDVTDTRELPEPEHRCQRCGQPVPEQLRRVFGDNENVLWACLENASKKELSNGAGADPEYPVGGCDDPSGAADHNTTREAHAAQVQTWSGVVR